MAEMAALLVLQKSGMPSVRRKRKADQCRAPAEGDRVDWRGQGRWRQAGAGVQCDRHLPAISQTLAEGLPG